MKTAPTQYQLNDEVLRDSEQRYRMLFEENPHPTWVFDVETLRILDVNGAAIRSYGFSREEFLTLTIHDLRAPEDAAALCDEVPRPAALRQIPGRWTHRKRNGSLIDVEISAHDVVYAGRQARVVVATDITHRLRVEAALRRSEERFRLMVEGVKDYGIFMLDPAGLVVSWNAGAERISGYQADEILGHDFSIFFPPEDIAAGRPQQELMVAAAEGRLEDQGWRVRKDGSRFWADVVMTPLRNTSGTLRGFSKVTRDLTERRRVEEALRDSEERFRSLVETAHDAIVSADTQGIIVSFNPAAERVFGYSQEEALGQSLALLMPERFHQPHWQGLRRYVVTSQARVIGTTVEMVGKRKDGAEFPLELSLASWKSKENTFFTGILTDITERKKAEDAIRERSAQMQAANDELEAFSYSVSHDLRAPLRAIDGFSQAFLEDYGAKVDETGQDYLRRVRAATQRMGQLIDDLLDLSRVTRAEMRRETVDLSALAHSVVAELSKMQPSRQVKFVIADGLKVEGDSRLLRLVLENLLGNAWKFTARRAQARIEFQPAERDGQIAYCVRDDGAGFDPQYAQRLFGPFQRLHTVEEFPGTGVGLATVQRIVHRHGGRVWAEGTPDGGAAFYFTL